MDFQHLVSGEFSALTERLVAAMEAEVAATTKQIQSTADTALAAAAAEITQLTSTLSDVRANEQRLASTIDELRGEGKKLRTVLDQRQAEKQAAEEALQKATADANGLRATIGKIEAEHTARRETLERSVQKIRDRAAATEIDLEKMAAAKAAAEAEHQKAHAEWSAQMHAVQDANAAAVSTDLEYVRRAFERIDGAPTLTDAVHELAKCLTEVFPRVVLFDINPQRLEARWQAGVTFDQDVSKVVVPLAKETAFNAVVQSGRSLQLGADDLRNLPKPLAGGRPDAGVILPVVINGRTCAVVYADDSGKTGQPLNAQRAAAFAEILLLHTMPLLARLAAHETAAAYERQLLNELQIV